VIIMVVDVDAIYVLLDWLSEVLLLLLHLFGLVSRICNWILGLFTLLLLFLISGIFWLFFAEPFTDEFYLLVDHLYFLELGRSHPRQRVRVQIDWYFRLFFYFFLS